MIALVDFFKEIGSVKPFEVLDNALIGFPASVVVTVVPLIPAMHFGQYERQLVCVTAGM